MTPLALLLAWVVASIVAAAAWAALCGPADLTETDDDWGAM